MLKFSLWVLLALFTAGVQEAEAGEPKPDVVTPSRPAQGMTIPFRLSGTPKVPKSTIKPWMVDMSLPMPRIQAPQPAAPRRRGPLPVEQLRPIDFTRLAAPVAPKGEEKR